jgi:hypothetical protein
MLLSIVSLVSYQILKIYYLLTHIDVIQILKITQEKMILAST